MQIQVGQATYRVVQSDERLFFNRQEVLSICEHDERQLLVSSRVTTGLMPRVIAEAKQRIATHLAQSAMTTFED